MNIVEIVESFKFEILYTRTFLYLNMHDCLVLMFLSSTYPTIDLSVGTNCSLEEILVGVGEMVHVGMVCCGGAGR